MSETERLARLIREGERLHARGTGAVVPQPWDAVLQGTRERYLAVARHVLAAGYLPPGVPEPAAKEGTVPNG